MSRHLIESITSGDLMTASDMVEAKLAEIRERKLHEMKRMFAAEAFGGLTKDEIEMRKKAGYRKAADVLGDPWSERTKKIPLPDKNKPSLPDMKKEKRIAESMASRMSGSEDKFANYTKDDFKKLRLKKDPRNRTPERYAKSLERYQTLKARGSTTASDRQAKVDRGYIGTVAKNYVKKKISAVKDAGVNAAKAVGSDLASIGTSNLE
jgi:hypothetical protein